MKIFGIICSVLLVTTGLKNETLCDYPDLAVLKIDEPVWDHDQKSTFVTVEIANNGSEASGPFKVKLTDLDISAKEARARNLTKYEIELIEENNGRAEYYKTTRDSIYVDEDVFDYDPYFEVSVEVQNLKPREKRLITFQILDLWVYNSNCELRVTIDEEKTVEDCNLSNNTLDFFGWG